MNTKKLIFKSEPNTLWMKFIIWHGQNQFKHTEREKIEITMEITIDAGQSERIVVQREQVYIGWTCSIPEYKTEITEHTTKIQHWIRVYSISDNIVVNCSCGVVELYQNLNDRHRFMAQQAVEEVENNNSGYTFTQLVTHNPPHFDYVFETELNQKKRTKIIPHFPPKQFSYNFYVLKIQ